MDSTCVLACRHVQFISTVFVCTDKGSNLIIFSVIVLYREGNYFPLTDIMKSIPWIQNLFPVLTILNVFNTFVDLVLTLSVTISVPILCLDLKVNFVLSCHWLRICSIRNFGPLNKNTCHQITTFIWLSNNASSE